MENLVHKYLTDHVEKYGNRTLVTEKENNYTFEELETMSNQMANYLKEWNVKRYDRVCLIMDSTINALVTILGVMKLGAIFVPISVAANPAKVKKICMQTTPRLIVCDEKYVTQEMTDWGYKMIINGSSRYGDGDHVLGNYRSFSGNRINSRVLSKDILYIMFTSGTTGEPKGVMISHESVCTFMDYVVKKFDHNESTCTLAKTPISFDPYLTEIVPSFIGGGRVVLFSSTYSINSFFKIIQKEKISNFGCGPSLLRLMLKNRNFFHKYDVSSLQEIYFGYENCPIWVIRELQELMPGTKFINGYGTTETYASSTFHIVEDLKNKNITDMPIGDPIDGTELLVMKENRRAKAGEVGELVVRGTSLMNGYWKNERDTALVMRNHPEFPLSQEKVYYTGDLVKLGDKGDITFVGRMDEQIKINGYRVELLEIEKLVESFEGVLECAVIFIEDDNINRLICFYSSKHPFAVKDLKDMCSRELEHYKVPNEWVEVEELPHNHNSKLDKRELQRYYIEKIRD